MATRLDSLSPHAIFAIHAIAFVVLVWWSWGKWLDPLIDFGRELYVPWQITRGRVLYRDIASLFGPLSPYVNALWFQLFGVSLATLVFCNLVIFAAMIAGIYRLVRRSTDRSTASAASLSILLLFGFSQYVEIGNYNFVCPYSHEATHGIALSVAMMVCLQDAIAAGRRLLFAMAGACFGLVLLTKPEIALAAFAAVAATWAAWVATDTHDRRALRQSVPLFLATAAVPPLLFFLYFIRHMESAEAWRAIMGAWTPVFIPAITSNRFYRLSMGLDRPVSHGIAMFLSFAGWLAFVIVGVVVSCMERSRPSVIRRAVWLTLIAGAVAFFMRTGTWPRALPFITATGSLAVAVLFLGVRSNRAQALRLLPLVTWSAFALVLLAKMGLYPRISHYGFYLGLPAGVLAIVLLYWLIPHQIERYSSAAGARFFRRLALMALVGAIVPYVGLSHALYRTKQVAIGSGGDRFFASSGFWQGHAVRQALRHIEQLDAPHTTLAVLPEGAMLNYLLRRDSPLRVINLMPPEILAFGEDDVLHSLQAAPPDFVLLVHRDVIEYGYPLFGTDPRYGLRTMTWLTAHYRSSQVIGRNVMSNSGFGIEIFRRNP
ncbi:MAG: glycosyltransferase family 39 protein [Kofleriaceae bacterium]|nr:glycosyltransferase family 39 protein [Candidatus Methylomirabilis lanthanidiphila]